MNSVAGRVNAATRSLSFLFSSSMRTGLWSGSEMSSVTGGSPKVDHVWKAQRPSDEVWYEWVPGRPAGVRRSRWRPLKRDR